ncbi:MAG: hypothetical protein M1503_04480 [Thaumarchaeota archaeon]|nr:hypothetical protein [Nitrososphaerota archaeon]MCL5317506.1 hypothetical protein [Nitrososphaerota archaeon]
MKEMLILTIVSSEEIMVLSGKITRSGNSGFTVEVTNIPQNAGRIIVEVRDINSVPLNRPTALSTATNKDQSLTLIV